MKILFIGFDQTARVTQVLSEGKRNFSNFPNTLDDYQLFPTNWSCCGGSKQDVTPRRVNNPAAEVKKAGPEWVFGTEAHRHIKTRQFVLLKKKKNWQQSRKAPSTRRWRNQ